MSGALVKIGSLCTSLPKAERRVADYVLKHPERVPFLTISELARAARVSVASVSRLPKKLGYTSFQEFKIDVAQEPAADVNDIYQAVRKRDSDEDVIRKVFRGNIRSLEDTAKLIPASELIKAAKTINQAERLICVGIGSSGNIARDAALRFSHLGFHADAYIDSYETLVQVLQATTRTVVIGFSHSGRSRTTVAALEIARKNGAATIGICNYPRSALSKAADIVLCTAFPESRVRAAALSSRLSQMCLTDSLYILVARHRTHRNNADKLNRLTERVLRWQEKG